MSDYASVLQKTHALLKEILGDAVDSPNEGSWVFTWGTVPLAVTVTQEENPMVVIFTRVMEKHPELLDCLNDINAQTTFGNIYWENGTVWMREHLIGETVDRLELHAALEVVGQWGDSLDESLAERFGSLAQSLGSAWPTQPVATGGPPGPPPLGATGAT